MYDITNLTNLPFIYDIIECKIYHNTYSVALLLDVIKSPCGGCGFFNSRDRMC